MPDGKRHSIATTVVAVSSFSALFLYSPEAATYCAIGALTTLVLNPDLDLADHGTIANHYIRKYAGVIVEGLFRVVFWPYGRMFKHRSFWSHFPVVSTAIRLAYLALWILPFYLYFQLPLPHFTTGMGWWLIGLIFADTAHYITDLLDHWMGGRL